MDHLVALAKSHASAEMSKGTAALMDPGVKSKKTVDSVLKDFRFIDPGWVILSYAA